MNCQRCHHTDKVHAKSSGSESCLGLGSCMIPQCTCRQYVDMKKIDEDLL